MAGEKPFKKKAKKKKKKRKIQKENEGQCMYGISILSSLSHVCHIIYNFVLRVQYNLLFIYLC